MNSQNTPNEQPEIVTVEPLDPTLGAMMNLASQIVPPIIDAQKRAAEIQLEAAKLQADGAVKVAEKNAEFKMAVLRTPIVYMLVILVFVIAGYALYMGKEAWITDVAKVAIGGIIGYLAGTRRQSATR